MQHKAKAVDPEGFDKRKADEDDVEGHSGHKARRAIDPEGFGKKKVDEDDDTAGHSMANLLMGRELARAREQEIQRNLKAHAARDDASRPHKK
jgi:hypothetical protein